ncbi:MAG: hypothetical protein M3Q07_13370 [Pseudobdellovibrionaceae bacterium]|nr:hypothetical protein [Pseudobdellovibrionaceae bacterium]
MREGMNDNDLQAVMYDSCIYLSRIQCAYIGQTVVATYKAMFNGFIGDGRKDKPTVVGFTGTASSTDLNPNIFDNFGVLQQKHAETLRNIESIQTAFLPVIDGIRNADDARRARIALRGRVREITNTLVQSSYYDSVFLGMLEDAGGQLASIGYSANGIAADYNCKVLEGPMNKVKENAAAFFGRIDELRRYVGLAGYKRGKLLEKFNKGMELAIYRAQANAEGKDLDQLLDELGAVLVLDSVLWDVTDWWTKATMNGLAKRMHLKYLQFRKPLEMLTAEMGRTEAFKSRIREIAKLDEDTKRQAIGTIDEKVQDIQKAMDLITKRGWPGSLELQKTQATTRVSLIPTSNTACHQVSRAFFDLAAKAKDLTSYEVAEAKYKEHVDLCVKS